MPAFQINIIAVGQLKERYWREACAEYAKRLGRYAKMQVIEVADIDPARAGGEAQAREQEAAALLRQLGPASARRHVLLLDRGGEQLASEGWAELVGRLQSSGCSQLAVLIGGPTGTAQSVAAAADQRVSLGAITLPHNLARVVALEQLYRAFKILRHEPYHK